MKRRLQTRAMLLALVAAGTMGWAVAQVYPALSVLATWQSALGAVKEIRVDESYDSAGYGIYRPVGSYDVDGLMKTCTYGDWTRDFGDAAQRAQRLQDEKQRQVYWSGNSCELSAAEKLSFIGWEIGLIPVSLFLLGGAALMWTRSRVAYARCARCETSLRPHYRYCPECGESIPNKAHPIAI